ncbi:polysaccharide biosynthesis/export family protein [Methylobacterium iners]|uniref:Sugar ABC transporter substrate-binding protein n=1 Tax=Methylobacterium iners TaxID=418707 RepID=A0ABQ4S868_9HYPH|nr:polysaccharide biosynthesis/export family protein [Methylobacterium iners]GJD98054.1 hypothetical protein OCOJLMKI_5293 [Methylobacterium iners]
MSVQDDGRLGYAVLKLSPLVVSLTKSSAKQVGFSTSALRARAANAAIGIGDLLSLTIYEAASGGLFNPADATGRGSGNSVSLPSQQVDKSGFISVPFAGQVKASGRTADEVRKEIEERLKNRAIEPQVSVNIVDRRSGVVSVLGEVASPQKFSLDVGGSRLLEAIARAGGAKFPAFETAVTLQRRGSIEQVPLVTVIRNPSQNIFLEAGDSIVLSREPRSFVVLGATPPPGSVGGQNNRRFVFESDNLTLAEAIAKAGGLRTEQADARAVFIYRQEERGILSRLGVDVSGNPADRIPVVYQLDASQADGYFLATEFYMRDRDLVYISDAPGFELSKFLSILEIGTGAALDVARINQ